MTLTKQQNSINTGIDEGNDMFYARWANEKSLTYHSTKDATTFIKLIQDTPENQRNFCETIREGFPVIEMYDIDQLPIEDSGISVDDFLTKFITLRNECASINGLVGSAITRNDLRVLTSIDESKPFSLHIGVRNNRAYKNMTHLQNWCGKFKEFLKGRIIIDMSIYSKNRNMRSIWSSKPNKNRPFIPQSRIERNSKPEEFLYSYVPENYTVNLTYREETEEQKAEKVIQRKIESEKRREETTDDSVQMYIRYFQALATERWDDRGDSLKMIYLAKELGLSFDDVCDLSMQSEKHDEEWCREIYDSGKTGILSAGSLHTMLKKDLSKSSYNAITKDERDTKGPLKVIEMKEDQSYFFKKKEFELNWCKILNKSFFIKTDGDKRIIFSKSDLSTSYQHLRYSFILDGEIAEGKFVETWMDDPTMRTYEDVDIYPHDQVCPANIFNLWTPFAMESVVKWNSNQNGLDLFLQLCLILCGNCPIICDYFVKFLAQMIQYPSTKTIFPTFISKQGGGKGTLLQVIGKYLGESKLFETTDPGRDVWGNFNGRMKECYLVYLDELNKKDANECSGKIKGLITNNAMTINDKHIKAYSIKSYHRFIGTTNKDDPVNTSADDRRNVLIRSSDELCGNKAWFIEFYNNVVENADSIKTIYEYLKAIPDMDRFGSIPKPVSEYHQDIIEIHQCPVQMWIDNLPKTRECRHVDEVEMDVKEMICKFREFGFEHNLPYLDSWTSIALSKKVKGCKFVTLKRTMKNRFTVFDLKGMRASQNDKDDEPENE